MAQQYENFIGGNWLSAGSGKTFENRNPANTDDLIGLFPASAADDVDAAVAAAKKAFAAWRLVPAPKRGEILYRVGELLKKHKEDLARIETREMGKVLKETRGDVQEGIDCAFLNAGEGRRLFGETTPAELPNKFAMSVRMPIGVCGLITPWNFPLAIPTWKLFPALICGNTVILKPAEDTPHTATRFVEILNEAGVPPGVVNLVHGRGEDVGAAMVRHKDVQLVSFTGSAAVGREIASVCGQNLKRVSLELGGKNAPDRHGRCRSRAGRRRRALGRLRHHRPALHGDQPADRPSRRGKKGYRCISNAGGENQDWRWSRRAQRNGTADQSSGA